VTRADSGRAVLLAVFAAGLLSASFQPLDLGPVLAWVALLPLLASLQGVGRRAAFALGGLFGLLVNLSLFASLLPIPRLHLYQLLLPCLAFALYPAAWCALMAGRDMRSNGWPWLGASLWVLLDYVKANAGFLAFPIGSIAQTQVDDAWLLQAAGVFGEAAITFLVVLGNLLAWQALHRVRARQLAWAITPIVLAFLFGAWTVRPASSTRLGAIPVAVLHSNYAAFGPTHVPTAERVAQTAAFLRQGAPAGARLVLLPESSFINPSADPDLLASLQAQADAGHFMLVVGVAQALKFDRASPLVTHAERSVRAGAWIFEPGQSQPRRYDKVHRLPFAEYLPMADWIAWPAWLVPPPVEVVDVRDARVYPTALGTPVGIMVCWESVFASHARQLARDGAGMLLQLSNEGWFIGTAAGRKHNATLRLRAVETGRPVLASVNAGPAIIVDRFGRIVAQAASPAALEWVTAAVEPSRKPSVYSKIGDLFVGLCALATLIAFAFERRRAS
jgi:apolipoprotein N-acyltransferase